MYYCRFMLAALLMLVAGTASMELACGQTETATATATEKKETAPVDPTGTWKWEVDLNGNTAEFKLKLNWDGKKLTGKYTAFDNTTDIEDTKLEKDQLSFVDKRDFNGNEFVAEFNGTVKPDDIEGTVTVDFGGDEPREFDWNPKRAVEIDDVVGTWDLSLEGPNGTIEPQLTLAKDGEKLSGKYVSPFGEREPKNVTTQGQQTFLGNLRRTRRRRIQGGLHGQCAGTRSRAMPSLTSTATPDPCRFSASSKRRICSSRTTNFRGKYPVRTAGLIST